MCRNNEPDLCKRDTRQPKCGAAAQLIYRGDDILTSHNFPHDSLILTCRHKPYVTDRVTTRDTDTSKNSETFAGIWCSGAGRRSQ